MAKPNAEQETIANRWLAYEDWCKSQKPKQLSSDEIDRQWLRALLDLIDRHDLDPAREIQSVTAQVLGERKAK